MNQYFNTIDTGSLCREGGNGPDHPSQIEGLKLVGFRESLLDVGCGSGTTAECVWSKFSDLQIKYKGVDGVAKHVKWCQEKFPQFQFEQQDAMKLKEADKSWDVVWSRHVVDHLPSFEEAIVEFVRVARKKIIVTLWYSFAFSDKHEIKQVHYEKDYQEYLNSYSVSKVAKFLESYKESGWGWQITRGIGLENKKHDTLIYMWRL